MAKKVHTVPHQDGWGNKREGSSRISKHFDNIDSAVKAGRKTAQREKTEHIIHKKDGTIQDSDSFGNDPNPPKDRKH